MDYLIYLKDLNKCLSELEGLKENVTELANTATEDLSNISGTEINRLYESITALFTRLSNGYNNCFHWLDDYAESFEELEKQLGNFSNSNLEIPIEFKGEFIDLFGKILIPTLKSGGDKNANLTLGKQNTFIDSVLEWAESIANDNSHGYSMGRRNSGVDYDCSSFVTYALEQAGLGIDRSSNALTTFNMKEKLTETGQYEWIPGPVDPNNLQTGDIILDIDSHVEMYAGNGNVVGARGGDDDGVYGDSNGSEIAVIPYGNLRGFYPDGVLRYKG
ncbi:MAG: C40 family peptidase [Bacilli bacterium]|nr:C40 family peptidase [Bacilli bacterium]